MRLVQSVETKVRFAVPSETKGEDIRQRDYLTITQAAKLLGLCRRSIYNLIYAGSLKASQVSKCKTIIRRSDVEAMMDANPYQKRHKQEQEAIVEFYTTAEIKEKYAISESWLFKVDKEKNIPKVFRRGKTFWSKRHIDKFFSKNESDTDIKVWYTAQDIMDKYGMTITAVYCMISQNAVPKKKENKNVYYSKHHVDMVKSEQEQEAIAEPQYDSIPEAMEKYGLTRDRLYHYCKYYNVPRIMRGKYAFIEKSKLDEVMADPIIIQK